MLGYGFFKPFKINSIVSAVGVDLFQSRVQLVTQFGVAFFYRDTDAYQGRVWQGKRVGRDVFIG